MSVYVYLDLLQVNRIDPQFRLVSRGCTQEWGAAGARQRGQGGPAVRRRPVSTFAVTCDGSTSVIFSGQFRNLHWRYLPLPVVPHKAVAEVSKIGNL
jgi:hypothetical protein